MIGAKGDIGTNGLKGEKGDAGLTGSKKKNGDDGLSRLWALKWMHDTRGSKGDVGDRGLVRLVEEDLRATEAMLDTTDLKVRKVYKDHLET